jgi:hypothetical protein
LKKELAEVKEAARKIKEEAEAEAKRVEAEANKIKEEAEADWTCPECDFDNAFDLDECNLCERERPQDDK